MITREKAFEILKTNLKNENLIKHSFAVAFVMEYLAERFSENKEKWFITGLLHDIDYELTKDNPKSHTLLAEEILQKYDIEDDIINAIKSHSGNFPVLSTLDKHLWATDPLTGLIVATALMNPSKKISVIKLKSLKKKFKSKAFAKGANREQIASCEVFGLSLEEFLTLSLKVMSKNEVELGF